MTSLHRNTYTQIIYIKSNHRLYHICVYAVYMLMYTYTYVCAVIPHTALLSHSKLPQGKFLHRDSPSDVTYGQVWWPILRICALQLTHPKCTHTHSSEHTHTHTPGAVGSHLCCGAQGAVGGSVPCSRAPQSLYWGWRECCTFTLPTYNSCRPETRTHNLWITSPTL